jgi:transposase-like protein
MSQLTPIQNQVLAGLLAGKSVSAVARENGIHRSTVYHWRHEHPYFGIALEQARSRHQVNLYDFVQDLTEQALETVATMLESDDAAVRLRAAQAILRIAEPARLPKSIRSAVEFETLSDQTLLQKARLDMKKMDLKEMPGPTPEAAKFDTIQHNPTVKSEPSRNSRCSCGSGLKYKRCCGSVLAPRASVSGSRASISDLCESAASK